MGLRTARVETPVLDHVRIVKLRGFVEEVDIRPVGARLVLGVVDAGDVPADLAPRRVRVTTRKHAQHRRGRLCRADGAAAAAFARGRARRLRFLARRLFRRASARSARRSAAIAVCRRRAKPRGASAFSPRSIGRATARLRVDAIIGGDEGAIAAAMVTGKRDFLSNDAKDLIREAGIFHIITISGVQMTLVAGIFFVVARRLLALSPTLALNYPIKKWAAGVAMLGSLSLRRRHRLARRHRAGADHDADRARRRHSRPSRADDAQSRARGAGDRRAGARGDPRASAFSSRSPRSARSSR